MAQRAGAEGAQRVARGLEHREFAGGPIAVRMAHHAQRPRLVQQLHQQRAALGLGQRGVVGFEPCDAQQLGDHRLVLVGALSQIQRGQMKAEHLHGTLQRPQARRDQRVGMVVAQRRLDHPQVGEQLVGAVVRLLRRHRMAQRFGAGEMLQRGG